MSLPIRCLLCDDHALVRTGFRCLLSNAGMEVVFEAEHGRAACEAYGRVQADVVLMDLSMPGMGGIDAIQWLLSHDKRARILALSAHEDHVHARRALRAGALGYLSKRSAPEALIAAVQHTAQGRRYLDPAIAQALALAEFEGESRSPAEALSEREFSVFLQLARGASVAQIAEAMILSPSTVGTHLYHIKQKLAASNQSELTLVALRWGLLPNP
ncbi:two-component system invasion response regulator UvrY [Paucibacter oligotrophus]|uniref:Two-component system invasion response regulator UvrY n=1 Tax=Roseateles oligotrophus TaxID=1769250 RepID=A0A840LAQ0_9BURK|nr:response regulator transcription factor [Roseateles oligotrophus]MBB4842447.1 two-component system invasion response regulator UvrY [Roseateles oligotrophus]